ncbi:S16 family serine protease [Lapillicoccus sp.]|uniref:YlbL family protein n=1 Tax=Lapillicoccus sp. TaxID=1909287 RepID=UPI00326302E1
MSEGQVTYPPAPARGSDPPPATDRVSRRSAAVLVFVFLGLLVGVAGTLVHLPYAVMMPGPISNVLGQTTHADGTASALIVIDGHPTFPTTGSLDFTTVRVSGGPGYPVNVWSVLSAWVDATEEVYPVDALFPPQQTQDQVQQENTAEMVDSQQEATAVALRKAGIAVPEKVSVASVTSDAASGSALQAGDVLVSVGGTAIDSAATARAAIQKTTPGGTANLVVDRKGAQVAVAAKTGTSADGRTVLGVLLKVDFEFPFKVTIDAGAVGGPSAGLMFSLGVYDKLTDGSLTGGKNIAGTGTIADSGAVGPIGGIRQKMVGAQRGGATFFLAPADNCTEVRGHVPDGLQIVKVATFDEGEAAVKKIGTGDTASLPTC